MNLLVDREVRLSDPATTHIVTMLLESKYCSWCHRPSTHRLHKKNKFSRNLYTCVQCGKPTLVCVAPKCDHMARGGTRWDDNLCAEHDGSVPNLKAWRKNLLDLEEFREVCHRESTNFLSLPESTRKIKRLLSPVGNDFFALDHFTIRKVREGSKHAVIFVNGFCSQGEMDISDWTDSTQSYFGKSTWYHLHWDATRTPRRALQGSLLLPTIFSTLPNPTGTLADSVLNAVTAWHASMRNAEIAGRLLANAILRTCGGWRFTLAGHSLGGRVVHFALRTLAEQPRTSVDNAYLLGAAVGGGEKDDDCWHKAATAVRGRIVNCYSREDQVLQNLYRGANVLISEPAGYSGIHLAHGNIVDFDCTELVKTHTGWKREFGEVLRRSGLQV